MEIMLQGRRETALGISQRLRDGLFTTHWCCRRKHLSLLSVSRNMLKAREFNFLQKIWKVPFNAFGGDKFLMRIYLCLLVAYLFSLAVEQYCVEFGSFLNVLVQKVVEELDLLRDVLHNIGIAQDNEVLPRCGATEFDFLVEPLNVFLDGSFSYLSMVLHHIVACKLIS